MVAAYLDLLISPQSLESDWGLRSSNKGPDQWQMFFVPGRQ